MAKQRGTEFLLSSLDTGKLLRKGSVEKWLHQREIMVHDVIKRCKFQNFSSMAKKPTAKNKKSVVDVNRDILAKLLSISVRKWKTIDFEKALKYPLGDIPLSLENADGTMRKTNKRKPAKHILSSMETEPLPNFPKQETAFIVDVLSLKRKMSNLPDIFERLAWKFLSYIPKGYYRVDLVAYCYFKSSINDAERSNRSNIKEDNR